MSYKTQEHLQRVLDAQRKKMGEQRKMIEEQSCKATSESKGVIRREQEVARHSPIPRRCPSHAEGAIINDTI